MQALSDYEEGDAGDIKKPKLEPMADAMDNLGR